MSGIWAQLNKKYPSQFNSHTIPVWATLFPCIAGGIIWAGYIGVRTLAVHNEIVIRSKETEPWLARDSPKLYGRQRSITLVEQWEKEMDP